ncbi:MAG: hypothetical protein WKF43_03605 [Acidimicrobiales bacterium]
MDDDREVDVIELDREIIRVLIDGAQGHPVGDDDRSGCTHQVTEGPAHDFTRETVSGQYPDGGRRPTGHVFFHHTHPPPLPKAVLRAS